jgi:Gas vesicle synthesis protein GvpL/GvpF
LRALLYCVSPAGQSGPALKGVQGAEVESRRIGELSLYYSAAVDERLDLRAGGLEFHRVLTSLMAQSDIVPFRFPTLYDLQEAETLVASTADSYLTGLTRTAGKVQMETELSQAGPPHSEGYRGGKDYLLKKIESKQQLDAIASGIRASAGDLVSEWRLVQRTGRFLLCGLVPRESVREFVSVMKGSHPELRVTGPWPATAFIDIRAAEKV